MNTVNFIDLATGEMLDAMQASKVLAQEMQEKDKLIKETALKQREKRSPYDSWVQLNLEHKEALMYLSLKYPVANAILGFLVANMNGFNACMVSYEVLQDVMEKSRTTIFRAVKKLEELGFVKIYKSGTSNIYTINHNVYWKNYGNKINLSKFPVNVILSDTEQTKRMKKLLRSDIQAVSIKSVDYKTNFEVEQIGFENKSHHAHNYLFRSEDEKINYNED
ncbi:TPA: ArsR family transcriptional regulator [Streptococcus suis]